MCMLFQSMKQRLFHPLPCPNCPNAIRTALLSLACMLRLRGHDLPSEPAGQEFILPPGNLQSSCFSCSALGRIGALAMLHYIGALDSAHLCFLGEDARRGREATGQERGGLERERAHEQRQARHPPARRAFVVCYRPSRAECTQPWLIYSGRRSNPPAERAPRRVLWTLVAVTPPRGRALGGASRSVRAQLDSAQPTAIVG